MNRQKIEAQLDKRIRRGAIKLVLIGMAFGFLLGLAIGATIVYYTIERTIIVPLREGITI